MVHKSQSWTNTCQGIGCKYTKKNYISSILVESHPHGSYYIRYDEHRGSYKQDLEPVFQPQCIDFESRSQEIHDADLSDEDHQGDDDESVAEDFSTVLRVEHKIPDIAEQTSSSPEKAGIE